MNADCIEVRRVYDKPFPEGLHILVDGLWPRGIKKEEIDIWAKEIAPSSELRKWYSHDTVKWEDFKSKYFEELRNNPNLPGFLELVRNSCGKYPKVIFLYATKETEFNNANALKSFILEML